MPKDPRVVGGVYHSSYQHMDYTVLRMSEGSQTMELKWADGEISKFWLPFTHGYDRVVKQPKGYDK